MTPRFSASPPPDDDQILLALLQRLDERPCPMSRLLEAFATDKLPSVKSEEVVTHLRECVVCASVLAQLQSLDAAEVVAPPAGSRSIVVPELLGESRGMVELRDKVARLLRSFSGGARPPAVFLEGETGTGKTELAKAMHRASARQAGPFVQVNCATIKGDLAESQLFGHDRGAFTGALETKQGFFQQAHKGTLFLDEIGAMDPGPQPKLLTTIENKTVRRLGGSRDEPIDVWVIAATNANVSIAIREGHFRRDLYERLAGVFLRLPPLRDRGDDIILLAEHFVERVCRENQFALKRLDDDARSALLAYEWPGNVRELENAIERGVRFSDTEIITERALELRSAASFVSEPEPLPVKPDSAESERQRLLRLWEETNRNLSRMSKRLDIPRNTLRYQLQQLGILRDRPVPALTPGKTAPSQPPASAPADELALQPRRLGLLRVGLSAPVGDASAPFTDWIDNVTAKIEAFGGHVIDTGGAHLIGAFGLEPVEDAPGRAAHTATALQRAAERARAEGEEIHLTLAVDVRRVAVGFAGAEPRLDEGAKREAWDRLEALASHAEIDTTVASEAAATFLDRRFELAPVEPSAAALRRTYRIVGHTRPGLGFGRRVATFVGRQSDVELLRGHLDAVARGQGRAVGIVGDAGIGKSRLLSEFRKSLSAEEVIWLEGACFSHATAIPYVPVLAIVRATCGISEADSSAMIAARLRQRLESLDMNVEESAPYLFQLFGLREGTERLALLTSEAIRLRTLEVFRHMILEASARRPVVIAVEDVHWVDKASEEILDSMVTGGARVLLLSTYRPGLNPPRWIGRSFATQLALSALSLADSRTLLYSLEEDIPEPLARMILDTADGNPFFLEETYRAVEEQGRPGTLSEVPENVAAVLLARIERLAPGPRSVLQAAAALGREFTWNFLEGVWRGEGSLEAHVALLAELEFLYQRPGGRTRTYVFKHSLTQQVAEESLSSEARRQLHVAAGRALESLFAGRLEEIYDRLAYHYSRTEEAAKAVEYLTGLARKAARSDAQEEAVRAWKDALQHVERLPPDVRDRRRLEILLALASSLLPLGRIAEVSALLVPERERLERLREPALAARYYFMLARMSMLGNQALVADNARRAILEAEHCGDTATMGGAYGVLVLACVLSGKAPEGIENGKRAISLLEKTENRWSLSYTYWALGLCHSQLGRFQDALEAEQRSLEIAQVIGDAALEVSATWAIGITRSALGEWDEGIDLCRHAVDVARDVLYRALATAFLGFAYTEKGEAAPAITALEQAIPLAQRFGLRTYEGWFTAFLAEAHRLNDNLEGAERQAQSALAIATDARFPVAIGWAQLSSGRIAAARGDLDAATKKLETAFETFSRSGSSYECARTRVDLARVCYRRGDRDAARQHLQSARASFVALGVPRHREIAEALATDWAIVLDE
jgi:DNA-binding NtrC family response regulator/tetratricopeptide (TPR) repeat protein